MFLDCIKKEKTLYLGSSVFGRLTKYISTLPLTLIWVEGCSFHFAEIFTLWKLSFHIVYIFKETWNLLTEIWYSNQMYIRNISTHLGLKSETSAHTQLVITLLYILLRNILTLTLRILFDKWGHKMTSWMWSHDFSWNFLQQYLQLFNRNLETF